ncbi:EMILIN-1-like [Pleurodeles waltl]|uniref:EMILIN-1-like n=1 Tax=Pleurodeles waltl TaxID=8319 RepID=UPI0037094589
MRLGIFITIFKPAFVIYFKDHQFFLVHQAHLGSKVFKALQGLRDLLEKMEPLDQRAHQVYVVRRVCEESKSVFFVAVMTQIRSKVLVPVWKCRRLVGEAARVPRVSFSAALTYPQVDPGTVVFDKVLVNDGSYYDPYTGIFTAPYDGRYFISAILTGHKNEKVEAVLSKSNVAIARVDSAGYQPEGLEYKPMVENKPNTGSLGIFNIILPLKVGDTVCVDLVMGKLAHSDEPLTVFSATLLYEGAEE